MRTETKNFLLNGLLKTFHYQKRDNGCPQAYSNTYDSNFMRNGRKPISLLPTYPF